MRTLVYGAGPLGSYFAARLHEAGAEVALLARGQRLADLRTHGVILEDSRTGRRETHHVPVVEELREDDPYDLVMVVMRKDQSAALLPTLAKNHHAHTVLFVQNNAAGFDEQIAALGAERVMVGFPVMGGQRSDPVMRVQTFPLMASPIGEVDGRVTDRTRQVADHLRRMRGARIAIRTDMDAWLLTHVTLVSTYLGVYAAGLDAARYARTRDARLLGVRARTEALHAQQAAGIPVRPPWFHLGLRIPEPLVVAQLRAMAATTLFEVGVVAHAGAARGEMLHLMDEFRARVAPGGKPLPTLDRVRAYAGGDTPPLPDGSREEPLRWGGVAALGAAVALPLTARAVLRRRRVPRG
jgi:2-dehydropantoate 2-reductase